MVASSMPVHPFYEPGAPPLPFPLLTAQTDLHNNPLRPQTLTNAEILPKRAPRRQSEVTSNRRHDPSPRSDLAPSDSSSGSSHSDSGSDGSELTESGLCTDPDDATIPKPPGEAGRPGHGGYTLDVALDWNPKVFKKLKVRLPFTAIIFKLT